MKKIPWFNSIQSRLILILLCTILFILCFSLGINTVFLQPYYETTKINTLINIYEMVRFNDDLDLNKLCSDNNITLYKLEVSKDETTLSLEYPLSLNEKDFKHIEDTIKEYYITPKEGVISVIEKTDTYVVCKMLDPILNSKYLDLFARYDNQIIYIRLNIENISETLEIANTFLLYVSFLAMFEGSLIMILISNRFTKPILDLAKITNNLSNLDFSKKYIDERDDEIGILGDSINKLSTDLQETIISLETANKQLEEDLKEKEKIDEMRKSFISDISHELKTPIALIQGYSEGLKYSIADEDSKEFYCNTIIEESEKMDSLVKKLTSLTQIEYGYTKVNLTTFDIKDVIENKLLTMKVLFEQKDIQLISNTYSQLVEMDEELLDEVLNNFLSNALNHIDDNKLIKVSFENLNDKIKINIFNTGKHIPESEIDNLWIKFYKIDKARTREYGGSGIGLSIVKAILTSVNQNYGCENIENGVQFWFTLKKK